MVEITILSGVALFVIGAIVGRSYERDAWQRRLLERAGLQTDERPRTTRPERALRSEAPHDPEQVAQAIDAMAIEIERIGEGQRFLTKLLAEEAERARSRPKPTTPQPGFPARSITPV